MPSVTSGPSYQGRVPSFDDERRISDVLRNGNPVPLSDPFGSNKVDDRDLSIPVNRKPVFGQRIHPGRLDFGGSPFRNALNEINRLNFASDFDSDLHSYKALTVHNGPFEVFAEPIFLVHDAPSRNKADFGFWIFPRDPIAKYRDEHRLGFPHGGSEGSGIIAGNVEGGFRPIVGSPYAFGANGERISSAGFGNLSPRNPELPAEFRGFGTRIGNRPKCEYRISDKSFSSFR